MTKLILIRAAQTDWQTQGRLAGDTDLKLNEQGSLQAIADARAVGRFNPQAVFCGVEEATHQTATIVADELGLKAKAVDAFREIDLGHWEGLTEEDFCERFAKVHRQWRNDPLSVKPPEGESISTVAGRLEAGLEKVRKRRDCERIVLVLGRFAFAVGRCKFDDGDYEHFWEYIDGEEHLHAFDLEEAAKPQARAANKSAS